MAAMLAHRGRPAGAIERPGGSLAVVGGQATGLATWGLHAEGPAALALAGVVTAPQRRTAAELLAAYRAEGPDFLAGLRGQFVLAILDGERLLLARDALGARTVYVGRVGERWCFGAEPKVVWTQPEFSPRLRPAAVAQYLTFSFVPGAGTMLEGLEELQPGHWLALTARQGSLQRRWSRLEELEPEEAISDATWVERFVDAHRAAVADRLPATGPIGVFLSGGIDSSAVVAELAPLALGRVHTFSIHFGSRYPNELPYARSVAERCGVVHHEVAVQPRAFRRRIERIIWHLDNPIGDPITVPNYELAGRVATLTPWVFNGEGGDPLFGGPKNLPMLLRHWYASDVPPDFRERAYVASFQRAFDQLDELLAPELRGAVDVREHLLAPVAPYLRAERRPLLHRLLLMNMRLKGAHLILPKVEAMTAAHGLVSLSPLFDERLAEIALRSPPHLKLRAGVEKVILKRAFADRLPAPVIDRPKSGMRVPVNRWLQRDLRPFARRLLAPRAVAAAGVFEPKAVAALLAGRPRRAGLKLWMLLTFELWRRMVLEGDRSFGGTVHRRPAPLPTLAPPS